MSLVERRKPLLEKEDYSSHGGMRKVRLAEVAGGTTAECAAVCCCGPLSIVDLVVLATYKVPAGLCRKALRKKRRHRLMKMGLLPPKNDSDDDDEKELEIHPVAMVNAALDQTADNNKEVVELDKEMWDKFYGTGFWRSPSQRSDEEIICTNAPPVINIIN